MSSLANGAQSVYACCEVGCTRDAHGRGGPRVGAAASLGEGRAHATLSLRGRSVVRRVRRVQYAGERTVSSAVHVAQWRGRGGGC